MIHERHENACSLFRRARELPSEGRERLLAEVAEVDPTLAAEVRAMLAADALSAAGFLAGPALGPGFTVGGCLEATARDEGAPEVSGEAGAFVVTRRIGEGTFATVWLAEQQAPVRRLVALKVLRPGLAASCVLARFERERHAAARMEHPNVARLYQAGTTHWGCPWFAMEYVDGLNLTEHLRQHAPPVRERVHLFIDLCRGVQHAHARGVLHRDLKPSNILVETGGTRPSPKVIDFGVARALSGELADAAFRTTEGHFVGTPAYMSPEQLEGRVDDVDTRTDVYALGVILHEMLTGARPYDLTRLCPAAAARHIRQAPPPSLAAMRRLDRLDRLDLETIIRKAMAPDADDRYQTPAELAGDVERVLQCLPISARVPGPCSLAWKLARRHRSVAVAAASLLLTSVTALGALSTLLGMSEHRSYEIRDTLASMLRSVSELAETLGSGPARHRLLRLAEAKSATLLAQWPDDREAQALRAQALVGLSSILREQGAMNEALALRLEAFDLRRKLATDPQATASDEAALSIAHVLIGDIHKEHGNYDAAGIRYWEAMKIDTRLATLHPRELRYLDQLVWSYERLGHLAQRQGRHDEARELFDEQLRLATVLLQADPRRALSRYAVCLARGQALAYVTDPDERLALVNAWNDDARLLVDREPQNATYIRTLVGPLLQLASAHRDAGRVEEAMRLADEAVHLCHSLLAAEPWSIDLHIPMFSARLLRSNLAADASDPDTAVRDADAALAIAQKLCFSKPLDPTMSGMLEGAKRHRDELTRRLDVAVSGLAAAEAAQ